MVVGHKLVTSGVHVFCIFTDWCVCVCVSESTMCHGEMGADLLFWTWTFTFLIGKVGIFAFYILKLHFLVAGEF